MKAIDYADYEDFVADWLCIIISFPTLLLSDFSTIKSDK